MAMASSMPYCPCIRNQLHKVDADSWPKKDTKLSHLHLKYIGKTDLYIIYSSELVWGESSRQTSRLVFLDAQCKFIGQYSHYTASSILLDGTKLLFSDVDPVHGNSFDLANGIPKEIWIDGEIHQFWRQ
ncbi:hypothetical protein KSF73_11205 [Burkholderiaceae bacterium DAT-1]|nr:hypothetical protein [Burkholderiaceae bacterium DAT-1]